MQICNSTVVWTLEKVWGKCWSCCLHFAGDGFFVIWSNTTKSNYQGTSTPKFDFNTAIKNDITTTNNGTDEVVKSGNVSKNPYSNNRPSYGKGQVEQVWEAVINPVPKSEYVVTERILGK